MFVRFGLFFFVSIVILGSCKKGNDADVLHQGFVNAENSEARIAYLRDISEPVSKVAVWGNDAMLSEEDKDSLYLNGFAFTFISDVDYAKLSTDNQIFQLEQSSFDLLITDSKMSLEKSLSRLKEGVVLYLGSALKNSDFDINNIRKIKFGGGGIVVDHAAQEILRLMKVEPQLSYPEESNIAWQQWRHNRIDVFKIENLSEKEQTFEAGFGTLAGAPELWNPASGEIYAVEDYYQEKGSIRFKINIEAHQTLLFVFGTNSDRDNMETYSL